MRMYCCMCWRIILMENDIIKLLISSAFFFLMAFVRSRVVDIPECIWKSPNVKMRYKIKLMVGSDNIHRVYYMLCWLILLSEISKNKHVIYLTVK